MVLKIWDTHEIQMEVPADASEQYHSLATLLFNKMRTFYMEYFE